jgi:phosphoesterase RecJ-like protein
MNKYQEVHEFIEAAQHIVVLQADNPDGDSLGSSLALEAILNEMGKKVTLVCTIDMPAHLRYLPGWDRVVKDVPSAFDATIIVDTSTESLFENAQGSDGLSWVKTKPVLVIDHHISSSGLSFANISLNEPVVATSELIFNIAVELDWPLPVDACEMMATSIMSDSLGLTTEATTPESFRVMASLVERGVNLPKLDAARRQLMQKEPILIPYKGELLQRIEFSLQGQLASVVIPWKEIEKYSPLYNPTMLAIDDMRMTIGVKVAIGYKVYNDGKITAKIRCNYGYDIADDLATHFGGGGHPYAAGFKILDGRSVTELKKQVNTLAEELLLKKNGAKQYD